MKNKVIIPELELASTGNKEILEKYGGLLRSSRLKDFSPEVEVWASSASNHALAYHSHGIFRYFGKFPPPVARHLIKEYTTENDLIIDPMCGSGTTGLEALLLNRRAKCYDVNPLSVLISSVKISNIDTYEIVEVIEKIKNKYERDKIKFTDHELVGLRNPTHWFLPETIESLQKIKNLIYSSSASNEVKDALLVALLSVVRRVSRATTQQGRLFLDVETAEEDAFPFFEKKAYKLVNKLADIPSNHKVRVEALSIFDKPNLRGKKANLIICHPPYFNSYKYSSVNSLELSILGVDHADIRKLEVREAFKVGKAEKVQEYLDDMERGLRNLNTYLDKNGKLALMIGDTIIKGEYIPVTSELVKRLSDIFKVSKSALRIPKFTEASWVASQRRKTNDIGINLCDMVVVLEKK